MHQVPSVRCRTAVTVLLLYIVVLVICVSAARSAAQCTHVRSGLLHRKQLLSGLFCLRKHAASKSHAGCNTQPAGSGIMLCFKQAVQCTVEVDPAGVLQGFSCPGLAGTVFQIGISGSGEKLDKFVLIFG